MRRAGNLHQMDPADAGASNQPPGVHLHPLDKVPLETADRGGQENAMNMEPVVPFELVIATLDARRVGAPMKIGSLSRCPGFSG